MIRPVIARAVRRALVVTAGCLVGFTAVMGFAHTKPGRPLLALMTPAKGKSGACPLGYDQARTPAQKEAARRVFAASHAGTERAAARPALGFKLDETTRAEVQTWADAYGISCKAPRSGPDLDCAEIPEGALPAAFRGAHVTSVWITFGSRDTVVSVVAVRRERSAEPISATFGAVTAEVTREAGPALSTQGDPSVARLSSGLLRQASAEYRFRDYYAVTRATNMGDGFALTEEYRSLQD